MNTYKMSFLHNEIYDEIPPEILNTNDKNAKDFVHQLVKSAVPAKDCPKNLGKSVFLLRRTDKNEKRPQRKKSLLSRKEKLKLKMVKCPKEGWNYNELQPLRQIWRQYFNCQMRSIYLKQNMSQIECSDMSNLNYLLGKMDYHGAEFQIVRSKNHSLVGISGTCVVDTKNTLNLVSKDNKCRTIPKADCVFEIDVTNMKLTVHGKYLTIRPAERSAKKIKSLMIPDL